MSTEAALLDKICELEQEIGRLKEILEENCIDWEQSDHAASDTPISSSPGAFMPDLWGASFVRAMREKGVVDTLCKSKGRLGRYESFVYVRSVPDLELPEEAKAGAPKRSRGKGKANKDWWK